MNTITRSIHLKTSIIKKSNIRSNKPPGFTLLEVLLALAIIAIALTALLKATAQNVTNTERVKEKMIAHWVAMQGVSMIQLNLIQVNQSVESTQATLFLGQKWYWRAKISATPIQSIQHITILTSPKETGSFEQTFTAFRYVP
jgi:general secretion pathway protein I